MSTIDQLELFNEVKKYNIRYPEQKFDIGSSPLRWFPENVQIPWRAVCAALPQNSIYLELGSFLGAGSTSVALEANPTLRAYCVDIFVHTVKIPPRLQPENAIGNDGKPVAFLRGVGSKLNHFLNNTWEWRDRVAPLMRHIDVSLLHQIASWGVKPDLIMIDDSHEHGPVLRRLRVIRERWPEATVALDDYVKCWDGVRTGVQAAWAEGIYKEEDSELFGRRLMVLRPRN